MEINPNQALPLFNFTEKPLSHQDDKTDMNKKENRQLAYMVGRMFLPFFDSL